MTVNDYSGGLRFAVMVNSMEVQKWQYDSIESLVKEHTSKPVLIIVQDKTSAIKPSFWRRLVEYPWQNILFRKYYQYFFKPLAFKTKSLKELVKEVPVIKCQVKKRKVSEYFTEEDIAIIKSYKPDFILKFGFGILKGEILTCSPMGIWSFHHGDEQKYRGVPPAFWEVFNRDPKSGAILQRLTEKLDGGVILRKGHFKTINHSWKANLDQSISFSKNWPADVCREIICQNTFPDQIEGVSTTAPIYKVPGNTTFVYFLLKQFVNKIKFHFNEIFYAEIWQTGLIKARTADILSGLQYTIEDEDVEWVKSKNNNSYYADGFAVKINERILLLFEDYSYSGKKGHISAIWYSERNASFSKPVNVLDEPWHLSYPFIFKYEGDIYCMPECKAHKSVELYKLDILSMKLVPYRTLIEGLEAVDPTLVFHQNHWYLFFTAGNATNVELHIWHAEKLEDEFVPHVLNPVKSDISNSRPAGSLFYLDGKLYRPAQDASRTYGGRIIINEIKILSEDSFLEMAVNILEPPASFLGLHNISFAGDYMYFDCKKMGFSTANFFYQLKRKTGFIK